MADNYPTAPVRRRENSLHLIMGRLPALLPAQGLVANKPHLGTLCPVATSPPAVHFKPMRQPLQAHLRQQAGVVHPWSDGWATLEDRLLCIWVMR